MPAKSKAKKKAAPSRQRSAGDRRRPQRSRNNVSEQPACPIIGIGGSAGGFEAASELLQHLATKTGAAFAVIQHLDPHHSSRLASLLGRVTRMPVIEIKRTTTPEPNTVYVQPPDKCLICEDGKLALVKRTQARNLAIDHFFESLADSRGSYAIGVILSGTGTDGTAGLRAIKAAGGLTFAQDPDTAKFDAMPRSAIRAGFADAILAPREIAREIARVVGHPYLRKSRDGAQREQPDYRSADALGRIFLSLKKHTGVDFSAYKQPTLHRRIQRRMALHRIDSLGRYARFLRNNPKEADGLFSDLLINVTRFFRDAELFTGLQIKYLRALLKKKRPSGELQVWVPGCASGEEVYSLAICILETLGHRSPGLRLKIFGTVLSEFAIEHARAGIYSSAIKRDVSPSRLKRFFVNRDSMYQISPNVRDACTFARQNIVADAPFSRLDLISCRNVLIYLGPDLHRRCLPQFHYALRPDGLLILGPAESVGGFDSLFKLLDKKNKIYAKKNGVTPQITFGPYIRRELPPGVSAPILDHTISGQLLQAADRIMLSAYAPAAVVLDPDLQIQQFRGRADVYLAHPAGPASLNILQIAQASLIPDLRVALHQAGKKKKPIRKDRALVNVEGKMREVNIQVVPFKIQASEKFWYLVIFDETTSGLKPGILPHTLKKTATQREVAELQRQLAASKQSLQSIIEEQEATNEELKSANEEIESSNEELQSTNEELETAKEELQSTNEELSTLNEELQTRNSELSQLNNDLTNLLASVNVAIIMLGNDLTIRRFTPLAERIFNLIPADVGRRLSDLSRAILVPDLDASLQDV